MKKCRSINYKSNTATTTAAAAAAAAAATFITIHN
jgi:hypothetical protein